MGIRAKRPAYALTATVAGPRAGGRWAGIVSPVITGVLIDRTGSYDSAFLVAGAGAQVGMVGWVVVVTLVETLVWDEGVGSRSGLG